MLLKEQRYSLQGNAKTKEGRNHPDRNGQFLHINRLAKVFGKRGHPVISVDTKKKELAGDYKNGRKEWHPEGMPEQVQMHDFPDPRVGKAIPYGVYDINSNEGWVSVGIDHDTPDFAVAAIRAWWKHMGSRRYLDATDLMITADSGGSNAARSKNWKVALQQLADETGVRIAVSHFPPGTSKWNKIEHRMFCHISQNWRGRPLLTHDVVVNLIANTTTPTGLTIRAKLDKRSYPTGVPASDEQLAASTLSRPPSMATGTTSLLPMRDLETTIFERLLSTARLPKGHRSSTSRLRLGRTSRPLTVEHRAHPFLQPMLLHLQTDPHFTRASARPYRSRRSPTTSSRCWTRPPPARHPADLRYRARTHRVTCRARRRARRHPSRPRRMGSRPCTAPIHLVSVFHP